MTRQDGNRLSFQERLLILFFGVLVFLNIIHLLIGFASIPGYYQRVTSQTIETVELAGTTFFSNEMVQQAAKERGMGLPAYAGFKIVFNTLFILIYVLIATIVLWKGRHQWFAWYTATLMLFLAGYSYIDQIYAAQLVPPKWLEMGSLLWPLLLLYMYLFPNGRAVPRWTRTPMFLLYTLFFLFMASFNYAVFFPGQIDSTLDTIESYAQALIPIILVLILICQFLRYRNHSTPVEKQQTKWFLFGLFLVVLTIPLDTFLKDFVWKDEYDALGLIWIPIALAIAILQYRLWDIDLIIRRTVVYAALTGLLVLIYFGLVTVLQNLLAAVINQQSPLVIVISTLAIAALFNPLRSWLQSFLERRFYRRSYNLEQTLDKFTRQARDEVDLEQLVQVFLRSVGDTLEPETMLLWINRRGKYERTNT